MFYNVHNVRIQKTALYRTQLALKYGFEVPTGFHHSVTFYKISTSKSKMRLSCERGSSVVVDMWPLQLSTNFGLIVLYLSAWQLLLCFFIDSVRNLVSTVITIKKVIGMPKKNFEQPPVDNNNEY